MWQKLKNRLIKKLGGYTKEEYRHKKPSVGITGPIKSRTVEPVELKCRVNLYDAFVPADAAESYARTELFTKIKPLIHVQVDELNDSCTAKIMILPYNERGELV